MFRTLKLCLICFLHFCPTCMLGRWTTRIAPIQFGHVPPPPTVPSLSSAPRLSYSIFPSYSYLAFPFPSPSFPPYSPSLLTTSRTISTSFVELSLRFPPLSRFIWFVGFLFWPRASPHVNRNIFAFLRPQTFTSIPAIPMFSLSPLPCPVTESWGRDDRNNSSILIFSPRSCIAFLHSSSFLSTSSFLCCTTPRRLQTTHTRGWAALYCIDPIHPCPCQTDRIPGAASP